MKRWPVGIEEFGTKVKEIINILEKHAGTKVIKRSQPNQVLTEEMGVVLKTLRENNSCKLSGRSGVRVLPGEGKKEGCVKV